MSYTRSFGYKLENPKDDVAFQVVIGDIQRLFLALFKGAQGSAYVRRDLGLTDLNNPDVAGGVLTPYIPSGGGGSTPPVGAIITQTTYLGGSGTHTFQAASTGFWAIVIAGGGGGTGSTGYSPPYTKGTPGGGGASGSHAVVFGICNGTSGITSYPYTVGGGGANGTSGSGPPVSGFNSNFVIDVYGGGCGGNKTAGGGVVGGLTSDGGLADTRYGMSFGATGLYTAFTIPGQDGQPGRCTYVFWDEDGSLTGTIGLVTSVNYAPGFGAQGVSIDGTATHYGAGGDGETAPGTSDSTPGIAGAIVVYEW